MHSRSTTRRETSVSQDALQSDRRFRLDVDRLTMIPAAAINQAGESTAPQRVGPLDLVARVLATLVLWRDRAYSRRALATFDRRMLRDIGVSPYDAGREISKPFWRE
jgi:uncharacterized protein YjiS (DUF1127 family)